MCPLCEQMPRVGAVVADRYGFEVRPAFCACGLGWLTEQMTREGYDALYAGPYRKLCWSLDHPNTVHDAAAEQAIRDQDQYHYGKVIAQVLSINRLKAARLLDAGGSCGGILKQLPAGTYEHLTLLDPAVQELPPDVTTIAGYLEDPIPGTYDGTICARTIDHLTDPLNAFRNMRAACPNGWLVVDFTDLATLPFRRRTYPLAVELKIDHPLYWNLNSVKKALTLTGWNLTWTAALIEPKTRTEHVFGVAR